tara:strand:+ start:431 stop:883 length:453 start_codon:yes stop_codon:yes gene_type:complete
MAILGLVKNITTRTGVPATTSFTSIRQISTDRQENAGASGSVVASAVAAIHFNGNALRVNKEPMEEFSFEFTYTSPCPCNGLAPCGEGIDSPPHCGCSEGVVIGPNGNSTCTDIWDQALMHCKTLTTQSHLDGIATAYDFTSGAVYFYQV